MEGGASSAAARVTIPAQETFVVVRVVITRVRTSAEKRHRNVLGEIVSTGVVVKKVLVYVLENT